MLHLIEKHAPGVTLLRPGLAIVAPGASPAITAGRRRRAEALTTVLAEAGLPEVRIGVADGPFTRRDRRAGTHPLHGRAPGGSGRFLAPYPVQVLRDEQIAGLLGPTRGAHPSASSPRSPRSTCATASVNTAHVCTLSPPAPTPAR